MDTIISALLTFTCGIVYDIFNVGFMHYSVKNDAFKASVFSVLVGLCSAIGLIEVVSAIKMLPFLLGGYFVGTYFAVIFKKRFIDKV